ncbi:uncharacterized protein RSE6_13019 [Rhynchosporium secalis]|uniref:Peptidase C14 caspase domain-containing protein n=1 Tax=Rhynchosporium secalis TaxID=38038 RepID=A0A1E1MRX2_RHYSE|nr:uncharacterized protein RSE6_13019 [Rhynchosporium secalis]
MTTDANTSGTTSTPTRPATKFPYKNVLALLLCWEDERDGCWGEANKLKDLFEKRFNFSTKLFRIPPQNPEARFLEKFEAIKDEAAKDGTLLIVYYSGHGRMERDVEGRPSLSWAALGQSRSVWSSYVPPRPWIIRYVRRILTTVTSDDSNDEDCRGRRISCFRAKEYMSDLGWPVVEKALKTVQSDVLVIMDCCDASAVVVGIEFDGSSRRMDFITACGSHRDGTILPSKATYGNRLGGTFTEILLYILETKADVGEAFTAADLHASLVQRMMEVDLETHSAPPTPFHFSVGAINRMSFPNVQLMALRPEGAGEAGWDSEVLALAAQFADLTSEEKEELSAKMNATIAGRGK